MEIETARSPIPSGVAVIPVQGDWDGDGRDSVAVWLDGVWYLDTDGKGGLGGGNY